MYFVGPLLSVDGIVCPEQQRGQEAPKSVRVFCVTCPISLVVLVSRVSTCVWYGMWQGSLRPPIDRPTYNSLGRRRQVCNFESRADILGIQHGHGRCLIAQRVHLSPVAFLIHNPSLVAFVAELSCRRDVCVHVQAIEEATASARAQAAERIAALQAQVLELQAGG